MKRRLYMAVAIMMTFSAHADSQIPHWEKTPPNITSASLLLNHGKLIGVASAGLSTGYTLIITFIKTPDGIYRCLDYKLSATSNTGTFCEKATE